MYDVMETPLLLHTCESWMLKTSYLRKIEAAEVKFLLSLKGSTLRDRIRINDIRSELGRNKTVNQEDYVYRKI